MSFLYYYPPNGDEISTVKARVTATGVALLMTFVVIYILTQVNWVTQALATFVFARDGPKEDKNLALARLLTTSSVLYLYAVCSTLLFK